MKKNIDLCPMCARRSRVRPYYCPRCVWDPTEELTDGELCEIGQYICVRNAKQLCTFLDNNKHIEMPREFVRRDALLSAVLKADWDCIRVLMRAA